MNQEEKKKQVGSQIFGHPTVIKKNFAIQMINKLSMRIDPHAKARLDPPPKTKPFMDPSHELGYDKTGESLPKFELRYLNNVINYNQFSTVTHYGRNIEWLEHFGYKLFNFIQKRGDFKL